VTITRTDIEYVAHLARLEIDPAELDGYVSKLGRIMDFIDTLEQADTDSLQPMAHPQEMAQRLRPDQVTETDRRDEYQRNAPETADGLYIVPRVVE
jgi:aspartyl-tRNA(Asn)/glutamyl-tRNA(Gln) amidotransferase subunit C